MDDEQYSHIFDILTAATDAITETGISIQDMLPVFADFIAAIAVSVGGEQTAEAVAARIKRLVENWKAGKFQGRAAPN
jgi:hypothetical protein